MRHCVMGNHEVPDMKLCSKCKTYRPFSRFSKNKKNRDGYGYVCKDCHNKRRRELRNIEAGRAGFNDNYEYREQIFVPELLSWTKKLDFIEQMGWSVEDEAGEIDAILACYEN